jgi:hypothetical protein
MLVSAIDLPSMIFTPETIIVLGHGTQCGQILPFDIAIQVVDNPQIAKGIDVRLSNAFRPHL